MSTPGGLFSYKASLSRGDQRHVRSSRRLQPKRVCLAAHPFGSRKWRSGLNGICHPDWVKFGVELNSAPKQNEIFLFSTSSKFRIGSRVRQTPEEGWRTCQPRRCGNNNKDEDNSPKTLNGKRNVTLHQLCISHTRLIWRVCRCRWWIVGFVRKFWVLYLISFFFSNPIHLSSFVCGSCKRILDTLVHSFILKEQQLQYITCQIPYTVKHFLIECGVLTHIKKYFFNVNNMKNLFKISI